MATPRPKVPTAQFYRNERGRQHAVYRGYGYSFDTTAQRGAKKLWRCHVKDCKGRLHTKGHTVVYANAHSHKPEKTLKEKLPLWQRISPKDVPLSGADGQSKLSTLSSIKVRADLLYSSVSKAPVNHWPELINVLQHLMDRVVQHVTGGSVSCVQIIPVDSSTRTDQLLTLHDMVSNLVSPAPAGYTEKVRPCSVVVDKLNDSDLLSLSMDQGINGPVSLSDIKQEVMDVDYEDSADSQPGPNTPSDLLGLAMKVEKPEDEYGESTAKEGEDNENSTEFLGVEKSGGARDDDDHDDGNDMEDDIQEDMKEIGIEEIMDNDVEDDDVVDYSEVEEEEEEEVVPAPSWSRKPRARFQERVQSSEAEDQSEEPSDEEWKPPNKTAKRAPVRRTTRRRKPVKSTFTRRTASFLNERTVQRRKPVRRRKKKQIRMNRFLVAEKYEKYDFEAKFDDTVDAKCFMCPEDEKADIESLEDFIKHMTSVDHINYQKNIRILKCPQCASDVRNRISARDGSENIQLLRLAGKLLQHLLNCHSFPDERIFLNKYQCDRCVFSSYECGTFAEHTIKAHRPEPAVPKYSGPRVNRFEALQKYENYDFEAEFGEEVDCSCPFCPDDSEYRAKTLMDYVNHLKAGFHMSFIGGSLRVFTCPQCKVELRSRIRNDYGPEHIQILRLAGKGITHLMSHHDYQPDKTFMPKYQCEKCTINSYDYCDFVDHATKAHGVAKDYYGKEQQPVERYRRTRSSVGSYNRVTDEDLQKYLPADFTVPYEESVDSLCPLCPEDGRYKATSLSDYLKHVQEADHLVTGGGYLFSMACPSCDTQVKSRMTQKTDLDVLKLLGRIVQHMQHKHETKVSTDFVPMYRCDPCDYSSFSYMELMDHNRRKHEKDVGVTSGDEDEGSSSEEEEVEDGSEEGSDDAEEAAKEKEKLKGLGGFSKFPERHINMSLPFGKDVDSSCPFCAPEKTVKSRNLTEFIHHVYKAGHLILNRNCRYIQCHMCEEKLKSRVFVNFGKKSMQALRVIGKAVHHLYEVHQQRFEEGFIPVYECDKCVFNTYSGEQLTQHISIVHKNNASPKNFRRAPRAVVHRGAKENPQNERDIGKLKASISMVNLHLANDIYENHEKTLFSFDEPLKQALRPACPVCTESPFEFASMKEFGDHCAARHVTVDNAFVVMDCPDCRTTLACKKYKKDDSPTLALSVVGKWVEHRRKKHEWTPPKFLPNYKCQLCQDFKTYNPRACHGHIHTPGRCRTNPSRLNKINKPCPTCGKMISHRSFSAHIHICSKPENERKKTGCPVCGKLFLDELSYHKSNLKHHIQIVHGDYFPHLCSICSTQFKRRNDLNRHMFRVHDINISNNEPLFCDKCDFKTLMISHLKRHSAKHNSDTQVTCHYCGKQYKSEYHLKRHIEDLHEKGAQQFRCPQCSYVTKNKRYLRKHVRWHFTSKAGAGHWCTICNYNARFPSVLRFHMKNVHKINMDEPGADKMASFKSIVMKRRYKNMKVPGDGGAEKMTVSTYVAPEPDRQFHDMDDSSLEEGEVHGGGRGGGGGGRGRGRGGRGRSNTEVYRGEPSAAALSSAASAAAAAVASAVAAATTTANSPPGMSLDPPSMMRPSCSQAPYARGSSNPISTAPTLSMPGMSDMSLHNSGGGSGHLQPHPAHHHHHHHQHHDPDLGLSNLMPAHQHRPIIPPGPSSIPSSSVLNPALQASEYLYNPQAFGGFLTPQGLPPQYY